MAGRRKKRSRPVSNTAKIPTDQWLLEGHSRRPCAADRRASTEMNGPPGRAKRIMIATTSGKNQRPTSRPVSRRPAPPFPIPSARQNMLPFVNSEVPHFLPLNLSPHPPPTSSAPPPYDQMSVRPKNEPRQAADDSRKPRRGKHHAQAMGRQGNWEIQEQYGKRHRRHQHKRRNRKRSPNPVGECWHGNPWHMVFEYI